MFLFFQRLWVSHFTIGGIIISFFFRDFCCCSRRLQGFRELVPKDCHFPACVVWLTLTTNCASACHPILYLCGPAHSSTHSSQKASHVTSNVNPECFLKCLWLLILKVKLRTVRLTGLHLVLIPKCNCEQLSILKWVFSFVAWGILFVS